VTILDTVDDASRESLGKAVAGEFSIPGRVTAVDSFRGAGGHINESFVVTAGDGDRMTRFLLQRVNPVVFPRGDLVMENVARVTEHLAGPMRLVATRDGAPSWIDADGAHWRVFHFIEGALSREAPSSPDEAYRAARAFGEFQRAVADLREPRLHETIPGFHDTPARVAALERVARADVAGRVARAEPELTLALGMRSLALALVDAGLPERVVHNDAKMSNVLLDATSGDVVCVVDLDTVMPGLALYDFGDMARSMSSDAAEDEVDASSIEIDVERYGAMAAGYLEGAGALLSRDERGLLLTAARVITYEQAVRFLSDYLDGDRYYRVAHPEHNLQRARAQLALLSAFERMPLP
jgi:Ser/Thr protein kinase RdoA (MazF antagonist)